MKVLAVDPGTEQSAWCALEDGRPVGFEKVPNGDLLQRLREDWCEGLLAVEMIASYGMPVGREVFDTCVWIGRYVEAWDRRGGKVRLVVRRDVKLFHCASARATDANIRAALLDRFGPGREKAIGTKRNPGPLFGVKGDCWAALALGIAVTA